MASKQIFDSMLTLGTTVFQIYSCTHFPYSFLVEKKKPKRSFEKFQPIMS